MSLSHLLDTSVLSQPIKDRPLDSVLDRWGALGDQALCTSAICLSELLRGLKERDSEKYWRRYRELLQNRHSVLPFDAAVADTAAELAAELRRRGTLKPALDLMIAATARQHGLIVATLNVRDFAGIPGVAVEDWSA